MSPFWILLELRVATTGAISSNEIVTTNKPTPSFLQADALPITQPSVKALKEIIDVAKLLP